MTRFTSLLAFGGLLMLAAGLTACATPAGSTSGDTATPSAEPSESTASDIDAAWLDDGRVIGLVTYGSSTCVPTADEPALEGSVLTVTLVDLDPDQPCTRDYAPRVTLVAVPEGLNPAQDVEIAVSGSVVGSTPLNGVEGLTGGGETDFLPSAGWTATEGQLVILTWGSSGCPPVVEDAVATDSEITVTFQNPPDDQVCTMDMAPRGTLLELPGLASEAPVELVLTGAEFNDVRVPILG